MINKVIKTTMVEQRTDVLQCSVCQAVFDISETNVAAAHEASHEALRYAYKPVQYNTPVYLTERTVTSNKGPYKPEKTINHAKAGEICVNWKGEGWYVHHEYDVHYQNDTRHYTEFRHIDDTIDEYKAKITEAASELRWLRGLKKTEPKP